MKNSDKAKYVYIGYKITFDRAGSRSVNNDIVINAITFGIDNSSSSHADNHKNNFLVPGDGPTLELMEILVHHKKNLVSICFPSGYIIVLVIVTFLLLENESLNLKPRIKMSTFQLNFVSEVHLMHLLLLSLEKYL